MCGVGYVGLGVWGWGAGGQRPTERKPDLTPPAPRPTIPGINQTVGAGTMSTRPTIAIIGSGFSGSLLALHLLSMGDACPRILLIERADGFGRGLAYATGNPGHLLNVRAGNMSAFPDQPTHFLEWLRRQDGRQDASPASFVARQTYGHYLQTLVSDAARRSLSAGRLVLVPDTVAALGREAGGRLRLRLGVGREHVVDAAVLAIGNFPPQPPALFDNAFLASPRFHPDPWAPSVGMRISRDDRVLIIGTGLTMVDTVLGLRDRGHDGQIFALSRRGLLPNRHTDGGPHVIPTPPVLPPTLSGALHALKTLARAEMAQGRDWQPVIDSLRPQTRALWQGWAMPEKRRFLRHLRAWWEVHRHRLAPSVANRLASLQATGALLVSAGRLLRVDEGAQGLRVVYRPRGCRGEAPPAHIEVDHVINCSGPATDILRVSDPLMQDLLAQGLVRPDPLYLGLDVDDTAHVRDRWGKTVPGLYAIGPVTRGAFWEITAVPDIRLHARELAARIAREVCVGAPRTTPEPVPG